MIASLLNLIKFVIQASSRPAEFLLDPTAAAAADQAKKERTREREGDGDIKYDWQFSVIQCRRVAPLSAVNQSCHIQKREKGD